MTPEAENVTLEDLRRRLTDIDRQLIALVAERKAVSGEAKRFGVPVPGSPGAPDSVRANIPRPLHWGGYRLWADAVELWVEGEARVHDRALWRRSLKPLPVGSFRPGTCSATRLQP